ncbi:MAG: amidohydrolase [Planctomycetes bacterium]|nr:amidohydrolase [Planctomycetota bacterium]
MSDFDVAIREMLPELIAFRHEMHRNPELAYEETETAARIERELNGIPGLEIRTGVAKTGIVATLNGDRDGRCVLLRGDMDALPIQEANTFDYRSRRDGLMHACGHDGHTTCLLGAARVLAMFADQLPGKVKFIFQPAEENGAGGRAMVDAGILDDPKVDAAFALHGWPEAALGSIVVGAGAILAAATAFEIVLHGKGTHAAYPHKGTDLILTASHLVTALQAEASRHTAPIDPVVVSISAIHAGETHNVLPDRCRMLGTTRALDEKTHLEVKGRIEHCVHSIASVFGARAELTWLETYPALVNDPSAAALVAGVGDERLGTAQVDRNPAPGLGAEDFSFIARCVPSAMWRLGLCPPGRDEMPTLHNPEFDFTDAAIPIGVGMHCLVAERFLSEGLPETGR